MPIAEQPASGKNVTSEGGEVMGNFKQNLSEAIQKSRRTLSENYILIGSIDELNLAEYQCDDSIIIDSGCIYLCPKHSSVHIDGVSYVMLDVYKSLGSPSSLINFSGQWIPTCNIYRCGAVQGKVPDGNLMRNTNPTKERFENIPFVFEFAFQNESRRVLTFE